MRPEDTVSRSNHTYSLGLMAIGTVPRTSGPYLDPIQRSSVLSALSWNLFANRADRHTHQFKSVRIVAVIASCTKITKQV